MKKISNQKILPYTILFLVIIIVYLVFGIFKHPIVDTNVTNRQ